MLFPMIVSPFCFHRSQWQCKYSPLFPNFTGSIAGSSARQDVGSLENFVCKLFSGGLASSTQNVLFRLQSISRLLLTGIFSAIPSYGTCIVLFVSFLYTERLSPQTVKCYLAAVRQAQIALGLGDPRVVSVPQLEYVTKGMHRLSARGSTSQLPITQAILHSLRAAWEQLPSRRDAVGSGLHVCLWFPPFMGGGGSIRLVIRVRCPLSLW